MHILKDQIHLRHRPWHFKLRFNLADHTVARYNAGEPTAFTRHHQAQPVDPYHRWLRLSLGAYLVYAGSCIAAGACFCVMRPLQSILLPNCLR